MSEEEIIHNRRVTMEDAWRNELDLRKLEDIYIESTNLRKKSWTIHCDCVWWETVSKIEGLWKLRIVKQKRPINQAVLKTRWGRSKVIFELRGGGRIIIKARNACFGRKEPIGKEERTSDTRRYVGSCKDKITKKALT
jgi:hypothetical protein